MRGILQGDIVATLGFLLTLLSNVQTIHITDYNEHSHGAENLQFIIDKAATASRSSTTPSSSGRPLSRLYEMTFTRSDEGTIRASHLTAIRDQWSYPGLRSNIETLEICSSEINVRSFDKYLKNITNLREFRYQTVGDWVLGQRADLPLYLVPKLLEYAGHSLHTLYISVDLDNRRVSQWDQDGIHAFDGCGREITVDGDGLPS